MIAAVIFDFDGVIIETETAVYQSWLELYREHGQDLPIDRWIKVLGMPGHKSDFAGDLEKLIGRSLDHDAPQRRRRARAAELLASRDLLPGVRETLEQAQQLGWKRAIASGSRRNWVEGHLRRFDLLGKFDVLICAEDTERHKPDPDPFIAACDRLGVRPGQAIAIEDSPNGVISAKAAGLYTVAAPSGMTCNLDMPRADLRVASLAEVDLADLAARLSQSERDHS